MNQTTARALKVGLMLPTNEGWMAGGMARWGDLKTMARHAEAVGFDSLWLADHLLFEFGEPGVGGMVGTFGAGGGYRAHRARAARRLHGIEPLYEDLQGTSVPPIPHPA